MKLNNKAMTKLLDKNVRKRILQSYKEDLYGIDDYARYVCDSQILQRIPGHNDAKSNWGFPQINILCCIRKNGDIDKKFFEFKIINHFLKDRDGDTAVEVIKCILILWLQSEKNSIQSFDYQKIDEELARIDKEIADKQAKDKKINDTGKRLYDAIHPIVDKSLYESYEKASIETKNEVEKVLERFKDAKQITSYQVNLDRNTEETIKNNQFFMDIGFKIDENDQFTILVCNVVPPKDKNGNEKKKEEQIEQMENCSI